MAKAKTTTTQTTMTTATTGTTLPPTSTTTVTTPSPLEQKDQEIATLKRQVAAYKGVVATLKKEVEKVTIEKETIEEALNAKKAAQNSMAQMIADLEYDSAQIQNLYAEVSEKYDALCSDVRTFKAMAWYKRIIVALKKKL